ncbi:CheC, inhibitor of MCP methylation [Crinalium epipsammum PCC 9333]|uniref:CheC, inhibitor of MCP methylation n=1 Tax=Crinalium epipsammum PCC 9333 TaxID=1173022 RepID=K9W4H3_9CYAN|nr:hypothetical protein [Crinalium epipsammum]AFZ14355.1 CheC, inhibitor of MCP methylation [Crinalium epipsammum PCC 9333]
MLITEQQQDALTEFINIAFARTASSLSDLVGERVILEVPKVSIHPLTGLANEFSNFFPGEVATIHQIFTGSVSGDALLLLDYQSAAKLTNLLTANREAQTDNLDITASEVLLEVGNILLNGCLGMFGNLLEMQVSFAVPRLHLEVLYGLLNSLIIGNQGLHYGLVIGTAFRLQDSPVSGYLVIVLGVGSLNCLIRAINTWADMEI